MFSSDKWFGASADFYPTSIDQSLRLDDGHSGKLQRAPNSITNRRTYTWSCWVKRCRLGNSQRMFEAYTFTTQWTTFYFDGNNRLFFARLQDGTNNGVYTNAVFRDTTNWYHIVFQIDTTNGTEAERVNIYVNGENQTLVESSSGYPAINLNTIFNIPNQNTQHVIGRYSGGSSNFFDGYMAEMNFIDGHALEPEAFGETKNGVWIHKAYENKISEISRTDGTAIGDLTGQSGLSASFDGTLAKDYSSSSATTGNQATGFIGKDWGSGVTHTVTGFKISSNTAHGFVGSGASTFTVKLYGSNSSPSNSTDGTLLFTSSAVTDANNRGTLNYFSDTTLTSEETISNFTTTTAYRYHWVTITPSSSEAVMTTQVQFYEQGSSNYYGGNGFRFTFDKNHFNETGSSITDPNGSSTQLADNELSDASGGGNHYAVSGFDSSDFGILDSPTNNYPTLNDILSNGQTNSATFSNGNLQYTSTDAYDTTLSTIGVTSGKWYYETKLLSAGSQSVGLRATPYEQSTSFLGQTTSNSGIGYYRPNGNIYNEGSGQDTGFDAGSSGDIIQVAFDADNGHVWFGVDNTFYGTVDTATNRFTLASWSSGETLFPAQGYRDSRIVNFGQDGTFGSTFTGSDIGTATDQNGHGQFKYTPPTGYLAICSANLPSNTLSADQNEQATDHFNTITYTGDGQTTNDITGVGFKPDWTWIKERDDDGSHIASHVLLDSSRGYEKYLVSNSANGEGTGVSNNNRTRSNDGFQTNNSGATNQSGQPYVAWNWKANGGTTSSNTDGTITSTVQANATAGFSIITYTGTGTQSDTVGHGLKDAEGNGVKPKVAIVKSLSETQNWHVYHEGVHGSAPHNYVLVLNANNDRSSSSSAFWGGNAPTTTVMGVGDDNSSNKLNTTYVMYLFNEVQGFSKFGDYYSVFSTNGNYIHCGFRPQWVMIKAYAGVADAGWIMYDDVRSTQNPTTNHMFAHLTNKETENSNLYIDFLSTGFKIRGTNTNIGGGSDYLVFFAFARQDFKFSNAR